MPKRDADDQISDLLPESAGGFLPPRYRKVTGRLCGDGIGCSLLFQGISALFRPPARLDAQRPPPLSGGRAVRPSAVAAYPFFLEE